MIVLVDENLHRLVVERLRARGHDVSLVSDLAPTVTDEQVLVLAVQQRALLVTHDLDFGELVFVRGTRHAGVLVLRLGDMSYGDQAELVARTLDREGETLKTAFSVLTPTRLRVRSA